MVWGVQGGFKLWVRGGGVQGCQGPGGEPVRQTPALDGGVGAAGEQVVIVKHALPDAPAAMTLHLEEGKRGEGRGWKAARSWPVAARATASLPAAEGLLLGGTCGAVGACGPLPGASMGCCSRSSTSTSQHSAQCDNRTCLHSRTGSTPRGLLWGQCGASSLLHG